MKLSVKAGVEKKQRYCVCGLYQDDKCTAKDVIYELHKTKLHLLNLAVHPDYRRECIGSAMIQKLKDKLSFHRRKALTLWVPESSLPMQLLLKSLVFILLY